AAAEVARDAARPRGRWRADQMRCSTTTHRSILGRCPLGDRLSHNRHAMRWFVAGLVQKATAFSGVRVIRSAVACFGSFFAAAQGLGCPLLLAESIPQWRSNLDQWRSVDSFE